MLRVGSGGDFRLGDWLVQPALCRLSKDGRTVQVRAKVMDLLAYLASRHGQVVSKDDLLNDVWGSLAVSESALTRTVTELRHALEDEADHPRLLETIAKRGYRLIGNVESVEASADESPPAPRTPANGAPGVVTRTARVPAALVLVALAAFASAAFLWRSRTESSDTYGTTAVPLTAYPGWEGGPSLSPDGTQVAFDWTGLGGDPDIYVKLAGEGEPVRLTTDPRWEFGPTWSPDGRRVAFLREPLGTGAAGVHPDHRDLMVIPALGGTARRIMPVTAFGAPLEHRGTNWMSWSADSKWLAVGAVVDGLTGLWLVEVDGTRRRRLTEPPSLHVDRSPRVSADGRRVAFVRGGPASAGVLWVAPLGRDLAPEGPPREIVDLAPRYVGAVAWGADQTSLMYSVGTHGAMSRLELVRLGSDRLSAAGPPVPLPFGDQATGLDVAGSGRVVYVRRQRDTGFWSLDLASPAADLTALRQFESSFDEWTPHYSPDGRHLVFASTRSGAAEIWLAQADGANARQMTTMGGALCTDPQWSPDGRQIVFSSTKAGSLDLYLLDPATATTRRLTTDAGGEARPRWSRDGRWIYFSKRREGQPLPGIWKIPPVGGEALPVTMEGMTAEESHDGRSLYVTRAHQSGLRLWRVPLDGREPTLVADDLTGAQNFVVGRRAIYYLAVGPQVETPRPPAALPALGPSAGVMLFTIAAIDLATGRQTTLAPAGIVWSGITLSPDERRLIATLRNGEALDLMLVEPPS